MTIEEKEDILKELNRMLVLAEKNVERLREIISQTENMKTYEPPKKKKR